MFTALVNGEEKSPEDFLNDESVENFNLNNHIVCGGCGVGAHFYRSLKKRIHFDHMNGKEGDPECLLKGKNSDEFLLNLEKTDIENRRERAENLRKNFFEENNLKNVWSFWRQYAGDSVKVLPDSKFSGRIFFDFSVEKFEAMVRFADATRMWELDNMTVFGIAALCLVPSPERKFYGYLENDNQFYDLNIKWKFKLSDEGFHRLIPVSIKREGEKDVSVEIKTKELKEISFQDMREASGLKFKSILGSINSRSEKFGMQWGGERMDPSILDKIKSLENWGIKKKAADDSAGIIAFKKYSFYSAEALRWSNGIRRDLNDKDLMEEFILKTEDMMAIIDQQQKIGLKRRGPGSL